MSTFLTRRKREKLWERAREERILRETNLRKALQLLRDVLDSNRIDAEEPFVDKLFVVEELLSRELGNPIWNDPGVEVVS